MQISCLAVQHSLLLLFSMSIEVHAKTVGLEVDWAQGCLKSLMQLHENTYLLPYWIVDGDWQGLSEKFTGPNKKYMSSIFDEITCRHGSAVKTLADAVIHARGGMEQHEFSKAGFS